MEEEPTGLVARVTLLGGAGIQVNGIPLAGRAAHRHPVALLALLVANRGRPLTRDKLLAFLWPDRDSEAGRNLLKVGVHELRKVLGDSAIRSAGDQLSADIEHISCDLTDFAAAVAAGDDRAAAASYGGPFLDGFYLKDAAEFERWTESERARLAAAHRSSVERLATRAESIGDRDETLRWRQELATGDPYSVEGVEGLVRALALAGDPAGALRAAESFAQRRRADLGIADDAGIVALARQLVSTHASVAAPAAGPRTPDPLVATQSIVEPGPANQLQPAAGSGHRLRLAVGVTTTVLGVLIAAVLASRRAPRKVGTNSPVDREQRVAVMPFHVIGTDSAAGIAEASLLAQRFSGDVGPIAVDPARVVAAWRAANGSPGKSGQSERDAARSVGATQFVTGEIVDSHDSISVAAQLYDVTTGSSIASGRIDATVGTSPATLADQLAIELIARGKGEPEDRIAGLLDRPVAAARSYLAGQSAYRAARYAVAESLYAVALNQDSTFGAAGLGLAMANSWTVINEHYGVGRNAALAHLDGMSPRDREFAEAFFGPDPAVGPPRPAPVYLTRWEDLVEKYPDWTEAWYQLGDRYYHYGSLSGLADADERARTAFRRALSQDSAFAAPLHHLVELYAARGELADLRDASARYFRANPAVARDASAIGWETAMALGDSAWLDRIRARFDSMPPEELTRIGWVTDANGWPRADAERAASIVNRDAGTASEHERALILAFSLAVNAGQASAAHQAAANLGAQFPDRPVGALWDLYATLFGGGDALSGSVAVQRLADFVAAPASGDHVRRDQQHLAACLTGYWDAAHGGYVAARAALARVTTDLRAEDNNFSRRNAQVCIAMLSGAIAVETRARDANARVAALDTILLEQRVPPHAILEAGTIASARLHAELGDTAGALVAARRREHLTGDPLFLSTELREEARFAAALGHRDEARQALDHLSRLRSTTAAAGMPAASAAGVVH